MRRIIFPFVLVFYELANYLATDMYIPALPHIASSLQASAYVMQQTLTVWFLGSATLQLFLGPIADHYGRKPVVLFGCLIFIFATFLCGATHHVILLLIGRFFQGCSICTIATAGYSSLHELYGRVQVVKLLGIMASITVLAPAFGPLLGSVLLHYGNWRWLFYSLTIWGLIAFVALCVLMPESNPADQNDCLSWRSFLRHYTRLVLNKKFIFYALAFCLTYMGIISWITAGPFWIMTEHKLSPVVFSVYQLIIFSGLMLGSYCLNRIMDSNLERLICIGLYIMLFGSSSALLSKLLFPNFILDIIFCLTIFAFGAAFVLGPSSRLAIESCTEPMGMRMAVFSTFMGLFGLSSSILTSIAYKISSLGCVLLIFVFSGIAFLLDILVVYTPKDRRRSFWKFWITS